MYAVIELQWHQYIVQKGVEISVDRLDIADNAKKYEAKKILCVFDDKGKDVKIGAPVVDGVKVVFDLVTPRMKEKKIRVLKFKNKNRYQKVIWFRAQKTVLKVKDIQING